MSLDQGQSGFLQLQCQVYLPGRLDTARAAAPSFTFDHTAGDWGCATDMHVFLFCFKSLTYSV